jgi:hypothetical protein
MAIKLRDYQIDAINKLQNGYILCGGVGSGKSLTALGYYYKLNGGDIYSKSYTKMKNPCNLLIITTPRKRDTLEWERELANFAMSTDPKVNGYSNKITIDSWNNIKKYEDLEDYFIIFDEQHVCGNGAWVKSFLKMTKFNRWILLSATPGDTWTDYIPVFVANGFYRNRTEFCRQHCVYSRYTKYPKIERYVETGRLIRLRNKILVDMDYDRPTTPHHIDIYCEYNPAEYKAVYRNRWNTVRNCPITTAGELCYELRRVVNSAPERATEALRLAREHKRVIIFYNFDYELDILRSFAYDEEFEVAEWNGHKHQDIPDCDRWIYLVQYNAGSDAWNCIKTDTIIFYSQNYSYKIMTQASGRIDRMNTPYKDLYYFHLKSRSGIDLAIEKAFKSKKDFNERRFCDAN